ncbi:MAG: NAD-dependent epimerase/dehydratase family protein [Salibacteraceae bacterium]
MRFAITGASGLIGRALTLKLADQGHDVVAIYRSQVPPAFLHHTNIHCLQGDVMDKAFLIKAFQNTDGVFHLAAFAKPWSKDKLVYYRINEQGTENVANACLTAGVKRMVFTSSAGTHGPQVGTQRVDERTWPDTYHTDYEQSKFNALQKAFSFEEKGLEVNAVSPARVYGVGDVSESNVPVRMMQIYLRYKVGLVPASGVGIGSYVFMDDVVNGHLIAMNKTPSGEEFLLGGENLSYLEFFDRIAEVSGKKHPVLKIPYSLSLGIGKAQLFAAENFGISPTITAPWVRKYTKNWGVSSEKIETYGYTITPLAEGMEKVFEYLNRRKNLGVNP